MACVVADFPTSNCFCYLIMSQAGKHPPPLLVSLGPPSPPAQGKFPGTEIRLPDAASDFRAPTRILQPATPWQLFGAGIGRGCQLRSCVEPAQEGVPQPRSSKRSAAVPGLSSPGLFLNSGSTEHSLLPLAAPCHSQPVMWGTEARGVGEAAPVTARHAGPRTPLLSTEPLPSRLTELRPPPAPTAL